MGGGMPGMGGMGGMPRSRCSCVFDNKKAYNQYYRLISFTHQELLFPLVITFHLELNYSIL